MRYLIWILNIEDGLSGEIHGDCDGVLYDGCDGVGCEI